jgi:hypothetical protein
MTLGNMRSQGVRSLAVSRWLCHRGAVLGADRWSDATPVSAFSPRMVCTGCGIVGRTSCRIGQNGTEAQI